jgi:SAM-dependent methyltransferase
LRGLFDHTAVVLGRDFSLFLVGARTDQAIARSRTSLGARGAFEAAYTRSADPWRAATGRYRYQQRKYEQIVSILPDRRYARALDLGCGLGLLTQMMAPKCDHVLGIDISEAAVALARTRAGEIGNMEFEQGDVLTLPPSMDGRFDLVMIADTLYYLDPLDDATLKGLAARMADLLAPGGICVLANHFFYDIDAESRVSRRIHDAFAWSPRFAVEGQYRRAFFLASVLAGQA